MHVSMCMYACRYPYAVKTLYERVSSFCYTDMTFSKYISVTLKSRLCSDLVLFVLIKNWFDPTRTISRFLGLLCGCMLHQIVAGQLSN